MKRLLVFVLTITLTFCFTACAVIEDASPGESHESGKSNTETIEETKEAETIDFTETAQQAYDLVEDAESLCKSGMSIISAAWHFGIWDAPECGVDIVMERLSTQTGFEVSFIEENGGCTADELVNGDGTYGGWEFCLMTAENCLSAIGVYDSISESLDMARNMIRELPDDYTHYQNLRDYYTKVVAYASYFENISGSYNDLIEAITEYENNIQSVKAPLLFDFG